MLDLDCSQAVNVCISFKYCISGLVKLYPLYYGSKRNKLHFFKHFSV